MMKRSHIDESDGPSVKKTIPESWRWVEDILDEAHLPRLGLPVRWLNTEEQHTKILIDVITNKRIDLRKTPAVYRANAPIDFITSTPGTHPMPGTIQPASVRVTRYEELKSHSSSNAAGEVLVPCMAHGDYVCVESLQADHLQAKFDIKLRQEALVAQLNSEPAFAAYVMALPGIDKFFVYHEEKYYGTLFFYELYFNDIDNIWLICQTCNHGKQDEDVLSWFSNQWLYGQEFLDYLGKLDQSSILLARTNDQRGLAQVAIEWYWNRHAIYTCTAKKILEDITTPLHILNRKVDRVIGLAHQSSRAERLQTSLDAKLSLVSALINAPGLGMPRGTDELRHDSSDSDEYLQQIAGNIDSLTYKKGIDKTVPKVGQTISDLLRGQILEVQKEKVTSQADLNNDVVLGGENEAIQDHPEVSHSTLYKGSSH